MKLLLFGLAAGGVLHLFGQTGGGPTPEELGGTVGGIAGFGSLALVAWLIREHRSEMKETREEFVKRETARDEMFNRTLTTVVTDFKESLKRIQEEAQRDRREMREENQKNIDRQFEHSSEVVAALERVNTALEQLNKNQVEFAHRLDAIDGGPKSPPRQNPPRNPPRPGQ